MYLIEQFPELVSKKNIIGQYPIELCLMNKYCVIVVGKMLKIYEIVSNDKSINMISNTLCDFPTYDKDVSLFFLPEHIRLIGLLLFITTQLHRMSL